MNFTQPQRKLIEDFVSKINDGKAAIFAGAGLSAGNGFVNWKGLLKDLADELFLDIEREHDLIGLAQYHFNRHKRWKINDKIINEFTTLRAGSENHRILARLDIDTYWTTNYDQLIERTLESNNKTVDKKVKNVDFSRNINKRDAIVYKMHGDKDSPDEAILTKDDFDTYNDKRELFSTALRGDLLFKTFLFIGFSFDDPNIEYILGRIKILLGNHTLHHYCIFKKVQQRDFKDPSKSDADNLKDFQYAEIKQQLKIEDLLRYSINVVLVEDYGEITTILEEIEKRVKRRNIFISGAAANFSPFQTDEAKNFIHKLSYALAKNEFKIVSGFGSGVGGIIVNGVLDFNMNEAHRKLDDLLILWPFPQIDSGDRKISVKRKFRETIISYAGIAIFIFGNKKVDTTIIHSPGMMEELEICQEQGVIPIPVAVTGSAAKDIWEKVTANPEYYHLNNTTLLNIIKGLGNDGLTTDDIIAKIIEAIKVILKVQ
ncbi:SIR2-like domain-containing protein [Chitinophaga sp. YR627]|uniref:SIR2 family protein n=1 Tax=Chitinophaga sp. YR627 TaxID=1881041 RepID=UPI0008E35496|nr:SIR2 family protein [Chitinophaga sp. YR627]SFO75779.1 SIR2-like domain-containing protein [Chitinophaga sp. YR627]